MGWQDAGVIPCRSGIGGGIGREALWRQGRRDLRPHYVAVEWVVGPEFGCEGEPARGPRLIVMGPVGADGQSGQWA